MTLRVGEKAPDFAAPDQTGRIVRLADYRGRFLVLYFYPKDETRGCTLESCAFRDRREEFLARGVAVVGVSRDGVESHRAFAEHHGLPFPLLADTEGHVVRAYDAKGLFGVKRVTYLIDPEGIIRAAYESEIRFANHAEEMLATLDASAASRREN